MIREKILSVYQNFIKDNFGETEIQALKTGTVHFDGALYSGKPDWKKLFDMPAPKLSAKEQAFMDGPVRELCEMLDNWSITHNGEEYGDLPEHIWDFIKKHKFLGMVIPEEHGGLGFSALAHSSVIMKISSRSITAGVSVMVPNSLGPAELIHRYGTKEQQDYYLPRLAAGEEIPCFALTGPQAGSDATSIPDTGVVCKNEKGELGIRLNWDKRYITLGPISTLIGLAFQMKDPDGLLGDKKDIGITAALVPSDLEGITIGDRHHPMGVVFQNGPNQGKDVFIPIDSIIGGPERAGEGWKMLMECLSIGRAISLPGQSTSGAMMATRLTTAYGQVRRQFNMPVGKFEGVEEVLARIAGTTYMMDAARTTTVQMIDLGERPTIPSAIVKYHLTENMRLLINDAMDIHGGKAICDGPNNMFSDMYKGIPVAITVEGANIMTRNFLICGQGSVHSHPYIPKEIFAAENGDAKALTRHLIGHVANTVMNLGRSFVLSLTNGRLSRVPVKDKATRRYFQKINKLSTQFNVVANISLALLGGSLKRKERVTARLGDVLSHMYLASATLRKYEVEGRQKEDLPLVQWAVENSLHKAEKAMEELLDNYPNRLAAGLMKVLIKPRSFIPFLRQSRNKRPSDKLDHQIAKLLSVPGPVRDRLTSGIHIPTGENEPLKKLEDAFNLVSALIPAEKKIRAAMAPARLDKADRKELKAAVKNGSLKKEDLKYLNTVFTKGKNFNAHGFADFKTRLADGSLNSENLKEAVDGKQFMRRDLKDLNVAVKAGIITKDELALFKAAEKATADVIAVDAFASPANQKLRAARQKAKNA